MAADNSAVTLAVVAVLATTVGGLLWILKYLFNKLLPVVDRGADATEKLVQVTRENTIQNKLNIDRQMEMHKELIKSVAKIPEQIIATAHVTADATKKAAEDIVKASNGK